MRDHFKQWEYKIKKNLVDKTLNKMTITTGRPTQKKARTAAQTDHIL